MVGGPLQPAPSLDFREHGGYGIHLADLAAADRYRESDHRFISVKKARGYWGCCRMDSN